MSSTALIVALTAYTVGVASPGPSNLAIMATAMARGRAHALALAAGVITGSCAWGLSAALGLSVVMRTYSWSLVALKIAGGLYMLWLSWKAARAALSTAAPATGQAAGVAISGAFPQDYARGLAMHLTNPKAIFVWLSIVALGLPPDAGQADAFRVVACCAGIGMLVFFGYALAFSTPLARSIYARVHRGFNAVLSVVFAAAGVRLLLSRTSA